MVAAFDLLTLAAERGDSADSIFLVRFFLINKIPLLVNHMSFDPYHSGSSAFIILEAIHRIDSRLTFQDGSDTTVPQQSGITNNDEVVRDFAEACLLHGLIDRDQARQIMKNGNDSIVPQRALETKQQSAELLRQNPGAYDQVIAGMTVMDGNAVSRAEAIAQVRLCTVNCLSV